MNEAVAVDRMLRRLKKLVELADQKPHALSLWAGLSRNYIGMALRRHERGKPMAHRIDNEEKLEQLFGLEPGDFRIDGFKLPTAAAVQLAVNEARERYESEQDEAA